MKLSLAIASLAVLLLSACSKEAPKPAPVAVPEAPKAEAPAAPAAAALQLQCPWTAHHSSVQQNVSTGVAHPHHHHHHHPHHHHHQCHVSPLQRF